MDSKSELAKRKKDVQTNDTNGKAVKHENKLPEKTESFELKEKQFIKRNSLLTELLEINHFKTIREIFIAVLIILFCSFVMGDYFLTGSINLNLEFLVWNFGKMHLVLLIWLLMNISTITVIYTGLRIWETKRIQFGKKWDRLCLYCFLGYNCLFFFYPALIVVKYDLPPTSSFIVLLEQVRLIMKGYAFVRENIKKVSSNQSDKQTKISGISKFLYFLFVPTLVYRDSYPRTTHIRWTYVLSNLLQFGGCLIYLHFILTRHFVVFQDFGLPSSNFKKHIAAIFGCILPAGIIYICFFFGFFHCWHNAFAELTRFADRQFYKDWWNASTFSLFYKQWNLPVQDWLYVYIYKDVSMLIPKKRTVALLAVFTISPLVHDYVVSVAFRFYMPLFYLMFGCIGLVFVFIPQNEKLKHRNSLFWFSLLTGFGLMMSIYSMEVFARKNCSPHPNPYVDVILPRIWYCFQTRGSLQN